MEETNICLKCENIIEYDKENRCKDLIQHLESLFTSEMTWENYGTYWHVDHIKPQSLFVYTSMTDDEFKKCWSLSNLQPLEAKENIRKSNKWNS
jgi:5-methylcytosine-specific restriction endonuclease McrA